MEPFVDLRHNFFFVILLMRVPFALLCLLLLSKTQVSVMPLILPCHFQLSHRELFVYSHQQRLWRTVGTLQNRAVQSSTN